MRYIAYLLAALGLSGCALNPQSHAGVTEMDIQYQNGQLSRVHFVDGKQKDNVQLQFDLSAGTASYSAEEVEAFRGQELRAALEARISSDVKAAIPGIVDKLVAVMMGL